MLNGFVILLRLICNHNSIKNLKKMRKLLKTVTILLLFSSVYAQNENSEFTPSGSPLVKIFSNYHYNFTEEEHGFQITRAYFGYKYNLSENFSTVITFDVADPGNGSKLQNTAFLKNAALKYKKGKITANFGLICTKQFKVQEDNWGYRYIYKSFQDEHGFNSSADMGADIEYKVCDFFSVDAFIYNGEGYKKLQGDNTYKGGAGFTIKPMKEITVRLVYDMQMKSEVEYNIAAFAGYENEKLRLGAEYNMKNNIDFLTDANLLGMSFYSTYKLNDKYAVLGRFDNLASNTLDGMDDPWNFNKNGSAIIGGLQYTPVKNVNISTNYQGWMPEDSDVEMTNMIYLNFEYKF